MNQQENELQEEYGCLQQAHFGMKDMNPELCGKCKKNEATTHICYESFDLHFCQKCTDEITEHQTKIKER